MTRFIALLAIVSGIILTWPAKADDTKEWCKHDPSEAVAIIAKYSEAGFPVEAFTELETQAYLEYVYGKLDMPEKPKLPGTVVVFAEIPNNRSTGYFFHLSTKKFCSSLPMPWEMHMAAKKYAKGE